MKLKFHIPDFYIHGDLNLHLIDMIKEQPEYFYDDIEIASCYGCFPPALWNGGRSVGGASNSERIKFTIEEFNRRGVPIRYTFTNPTITESDLKDIFCNRLCRLADNGFNEIIVNKPFLESYIRNKYPKYPIISSTVKQIEDYEQLIEELNKEYKLVVLDYNWNNDFDRLGNIPEEYRSRCEILINPYCMPNCKRRGEHYRVLGECQRKYNNVGNEILTARNPHKINVEEISKEVREFGCQCPDMNFEQIKSFATFVSRENVFGRYLEMGFNNFKIEGRVLQHENVVDSYLYYMVKDEYKDIVKEDLLNYKPEKPLDSIRPKRFFIDYDGKEIPQSDE